MDARSCHLSLFVTFLLAICAAPALAATIGPLPYHDIRDSPFNLSHLGTDFFVEDFSNGIEEFTREPNNYQVAKFLTPGAYATGGYTMARNSIMYVFGHYSDYAARIASVRLSIEFEVAELGWLPQAVGFVTSNSESLELDVYGPDNTLLETLSVTSAPLPDPIPPLSGLKNTLEFYRRDRFFGAINPAGISRIDLTAALATTFIDDFQYGKLVPEPTTTLLTFTAVLGILLLQGRSRPVLAQRY